MGSAWGWGVSGETLSHCVLWQLQKWFGRSGDLGEQDYVVTRLRWEIFMWFVKATPWLWVGLFEVGC